MVINQKECLANECSLLPTTPHCAAAIKQTDKDTKSIGIRFFLHHDTVYLYREKHSAEEGKTATLNKGDMP